MSTMWRLCSQMWVIYLSWKSGLINRLDEKEMDSNCGWALRDRPTRTNWIDRQEWLFGLFEFVGQVSLWTLYMIQSVPGNKEDPSICPFGMLLFPWLHLIHQGFIVQTSQSETPLEFLWIPFDTLLLPLPLKSNNLVELMTSWFIAHLLLPACAWFTSTDDCPSTL